MAAEKCLQQSCDGFEGSKRVFTHSQLCFLTDALDAGESTPSFHGTTGWLRGTWAQLEQTVKFFPSSLWSSRDFNFDPGFVDSFRAMSSMDSFFAIHHLVGFMKIGNFFPVWAGVVIVGTILCFAMLILTEYHSKPRYHSVRTWHVLRSSARISIPSRVSPSSALLFRWCGSIVSPTRLLICSPLSVSFSILATPSSGWHSSLGAIVWAVSSRERGRDSEMSRMF